LDGKENRNTLQATYFVTKMPSIYNVENLIQNDLACLSQLQPEGWPDILVHYKFYLNSTFCLPVKIEIDNKIVAIGAAIMHKQTAWLGHIIVHEEYRNKGLGSTITQSLIESLHKADYKTILLIATKLGEPVYKKLGFEKETEYVSYATPQNNLNIFEDVIPFEIGFKKQLLELDYLATGEMRKHILTPHLLNGKLILENKSVKGFYLPTLGEGLIIANTPDAGKKLLMNKLTTGSRMALPADNTVGVEFLLQNGFTEGFRGAKMRLGQKIICRPEIIYSRIGGNLG
jgi:ribosomal protein S18 acetylase RimI-like enzyme